MTRKTLTFKTAIGDAAGDRTFPVTLSNGRLDREGDTVDPNGWMYADRVPFQVNHAHDVLSTCGYVSGFHVRGDEFRGVITVAPAGIADVIDEVFRRMTAKVNRDVSVGFQPNEFDMTDTGVAFKKQTLFELSLVAVPACPGAQIDAQAQAAVSKWLGKASDLSPGAGKPPRVPVGSPDIVLPAGDDDADEAIYVQMQQYVAAGGTGVSMIADAIKELLAPEVAGTSAEDDALNDVVQLTTVVQQSAAVVDAMTAVLHLALPLLPKPKSKTSKSGRVLSAQNEAALRAAVAALEEVLSKLEPPKGGTVPARRGMGRASQAQVLRLDDEFRFEDLHITEADIRDILVKAVSEQMMRVTGKVD
jgi:hypothetical protein